LAVRKSLLAANGYQVLTALDGPIGIELARKNFN
jgi:hypothetical protein